MTQFFHTSRDIDASVAQNKDISADRQPNDHVPADKAPTFRHQIAPEVTLSDFLIYVLKFEPGKEYRVDAVLKLAADGVVLFDTVTSTDLDFSPEGAQGVITASPIVGHDDEGR